MTLIPQHWCFWPIRHPHGGYHGTSPTLARFLQDEFELGERVAYGMDDEEVWGGASIVILFMGAPGAPWEGH